MRNDIHDSDGDDDDGDDDLDHRTTVTAHRHVTPDFKARQQESKKKLYGVKSHNCLLCRHARKGASTHTPSFMSLDINDRQEKRESDSLTQRTAGDSLTHILTDERAGETRGRTHALGCMSERSSVGRETVVDESQRETNDRREGNAILSHVLQILLSFFAPVVVDVVRLRTMSASRQQDRREKSRRRRDAGNERENERLMGSRSRNRDSQQTLTSICQTDRRSSKNSCLSISPSSRLLFI